MASQYFSLEAFKEAFKSLMPRGGAWPREIGTVQDKIITVFAKAYERLTARANHLLIDAFPATTVELLPEWEKTLALPDPDLPPQETLQGRQAMVVAKLIGLGGQSQYFYKLYAKTLGYEIEVTNYAPFRASAGRCGQELRSEEWAHIWSITSKANTTTYFRAGRSAAGERLASWNDALLERAMHKVKPSHTHLIFKYTE